MIIETLSSILPIIPNLLSAGKSVYNIIIKPLLLSLGYKISHNDEEEFRKLENKKDIEGIRKKINNIEYEINLRQNNSGDKNSQIGVNNGIAFFNSPITGGGEENTENNDKQNIEYDKMMDVRLYIVKKIANMMNEERENTIEFKIFGMRFGAIKGILCDILYEIKERKKDVILKNKLNIYLYFCDPEYLKYIGKYRKYSKK